MKFQGTLIAFFLSNWVESSALNLTAKSPLSSSLDTDSNTPVENSDSYLYDQMKNGNGVRRLKKGKIDEQKGKTGKLGKVRKSQKGSFPPTPTPAPLGTLLKQPHKLNYEKQTLCIPGVMMYGCSNAANVAMEEPITIKSLRVYDM